jgi:hypothetical protein
VERKRVCHFCEYAEEVRLEIPDGHLGCIASVATWWHHFELEFLFFFDVEFHVVQDFVVEDLLSWVYVGR